jgi:hypothetical protein
MPDFAETGLSLSKRAAAALGTIPKKKFKY